MARRQDPDCATHPLATSLSQSHAPGHSLWSLWSVVCVHHRRSWALTTSSLRSYNEQGETHHKQVFQVVWFDSPAWQLVGLCQNVTFADI
ncbi:hypothetical protein QC764_0060730 [Podospora pseudoanserina]|uniref:Uncharacterized protein n=1 Tax=Podospora pseudoanserina TaxID=2609844 RepID=A0ABR0I7X4_9PEZI|nr:hypothetical protein QC764_0060730 [Podospora pseudoanserina]